MENADSADDKNVAAGFYRKAETLFDQLIGYEDADDKSLLCSRKAKECEIAIESKKISEKKENDNNHSDVQESIENQADKANVKNADTKSPEGNSKSKALIAVIIIGALIAGGVVFAMTRGKTGNQNESNIASDNSSGGGEQYLGDLIPVEDGIEIKWDTGSAVLKNYQLEKSEYDGDCVDLYFEYTKSGGEDETFNSALDVSVYQNGYELDEKNYLTIDAENNSFNEVKKGATITAAKGFLLNDSSELTVVLTAHDSDYNPIIERMTLTIPKDKEADISGNKQYFEDTGVAANPV